jgi:Zn finger protein HypA/HybF involved in hydrogenase expression
MNTVFRNSLLIIISLVAVYFISIFISEKVLVKNKFNGCIDCHGEMEGFSAAHSPEKIGCESCHLGNSFTSNKGFAHKGMILIPGNLSDAEKTCGATGCHPGIPQRIQNSLMNTMSGVISVDRFAFDEIDKPAGLFRVKDLMQSDADNHLRNLCASCHLGNEKTELGPITELSRGGGCNACHLSYNNEAIQQLSNYLKSKVKGQKSKEIKIEFPVIHPQLSLNLTNNHCFGCHARSGRISTNYQGWFETLLTVEEIKNISHSELVSESDVKKLKQVQLDTIKAQFRVLLDGRVFQKTKDDIHHQAGMECVDCHLATEVMGDGNLYEHMEEQVRIQCTDCHSNETHSVSYDDLDFESKKVVNLRNLNESNNKFLVTDKLATPIVNAFVSSSNEKFLITKNTKSKLQIKPPAQICVEGKSHQRLSCNSCHTEWVSHCVGCHTEYDPTLEGFDLLDNKEILGSWRETPSDFYIDFPTLGIKKDKKGKEIIDTFIPGMVLTIDKMKDNPDKKIFKRLFAPTFSHTISKKGRSCKSCHNNPLTLGYGKGTLNFDRNRKWRFTPYFSNHKEDNMPKDAWIGFLKTRDETSTTRTYTRPFTVEEQKSILLVGACLTCHEEDSEIMKKSLIDFESVLNNRSSKCVMPAWN